MIGTTYSVIQPDIYQTFKDGDDFERIIDNYIIETHSDDPQKREYLLSLPKREKRLKALSLRTKDLYEWKTLIDKITGSRVSNVDHLKQIIADFREFIKRAKVEDKLFGEVMTPLDELARPMVDLVEKYDDDFWKTPKKVLDSSAGIGTFLVICAAKFMNGLKNYPGLEDPEVRFKFIVEFCLYYGELQSGNAALWLSVIDPYDEYKTNTFWGSFLSEDFNKHKNEVWKVDSWDLIIQNPPYNDGTQNIGNTLWDKFVSKSISIIKEGGYLVLVHPCGWRNIDGKFVKVKNEILSKDILYLNINSYQDGLDVFKAGTPFDYYILRNSKTESLLTDIVDIDNTHYKLNLKEVEFIPNCDFDLIFGLIDRSIDNRIRVLSSYDYEPRRNWMSNVETSEHRYPCVYSILGNGDINLKWSSLNKGHFGIPKIICGNGANPTFIEDFEGKYGMTQWVYGICGDVDDLKEISRFLKSDIVKRITRATKFVSTAGNPIIYPRIISLFKKDFWKDFT